MEQNNINFNHSIILENRKQISLSGVSECLGFDEETIALDTKLGKLTIKGIGLHVLNFNTDTGELTAEGRINAIFYTSAESDKSFFRKLFK